MLSNEEFLIEEFALRPHSDSFGVERSLKVKGRGEHTVVKQDKIFKHIWGLRNEVVRDKVISEFTGVDRLELPERNCFGKVKWFGKVKEKV